MEHWYWEGRALAARVEQVGKNRQRSIGKVELLFLLSIVTSDQSIGRVELLFVYHYFSWFFSSSRRGEAQERGGAFPYLTFAV